MVDVANRLARFFSTRSPTAVVSAYLFGSHATARAHQESDVDVGVLLDRAIVPTTAARFEVRLELLAELTGLFGHREVDVVVLNDAPPLFARKILHEGLRVYLVDAEQDRVFWRDAQILAADIEPWLRRAWTKKLEALAR